MEDRRSSAKPISGNDVSVQIHDYIAKTASKPFLKPVKVLLKAPVSVYKKHVPLFFRSGGRRQSHRKVNMEACIASLPDVIDPSQVPWPQLTSQPVARLRAKWIPGQIDNYGFPIGFEQSGAFCHGPRLVQIVEVILR